MATRRKKTTTEETPIVESEPRYSLGQLRNNCLALFGVTQSTFAGATFKLLTARQIDGKPLEFTVSEIAELIKAWKNEQTKQ